MTSLQPKFSQKSIQSSPSNNELELLPKKAGWTKCLIFSSIVASIGSFNYGFNLSVIDAPSEIFTKCNTSNTLGFGLLPQCVNVHGFWNLIVTIFCIGGLIGSLSSSHLNIYLGRRKSLIYNCFIFIFGGLLMSLAVNFYMLLFGRLLIGFASGLATCTVPSFLAEIAPDHIRGRVASFHQCMLVIGIIVAQGLSFPLVSTVDQTWRILFAITSALALFQLILLFYIPESPAFLSACDDIISLEISLRRLRNSNNVTDDISRLKKLSNQSIQNSKPLSIIQLLALPEARQSVFVASFTHLAQQLSGINAYFFYSISIFSGIYLPFSLKVIPLILGIVNAFVSCSSIFFIDKTGRKSLLLVSTIICILTSCCIIIAFLFNITILKVISPVLFVAGFAIGLGPVPWIIVGDIFPAEAISSGTSLSITVNWLCNGIVAFSTEALCKSLGAWAFLPFLCVLSAYLCFAVIFIPETKGIIPAYLRSKPISNHRMTQVNFRA